MNKAELIIGWIIGEKYHKSMLNSANMLDDGPVCNGLKALRQLKNRSKFRRFVDSDLKLIQPYLSENVYAIFTQLQAKLKNSNSILWACMECDIVFEDDCTCWFCERCLLWFHVQCQNIYPREDRAEHKYCKECYKDLLDH